MPRDPAPGTAPVSAPALSARQLQVLQAMADGLGTALTARRLGLSVCTVKTHVLHLFNKLQVDNRAAAVAAGFRRGFLKVTQ